MSKISEQKPAVSIMQVFEGYKVLSEDHEHLRKKAHTIRPLIFIDGYIIIKIKGIVLENHPASIEEIKRPCSVILRVTLLIMNRKR